MIESEQSEIHHINSQQEERKHYLDEKLHAEGPSEVKVCFSATDSHRIFILIKHQIFILPDVL